MRKPGHYLSGRVKANSPTSVDADRYSYLSLENAEPNLGSPTANNGMLISSDIGLRQWVQLGSGISVANGELTVDTANLEVIQTIVNQSISNTDLQTATDFGNITTNDIILNTSNLVFDTGSFNTTLSAATATAARTITLPNASGELLTTGVGNLVYAGDPPLTGYDYYVTNGTSSYKLDPTDAVAGYLQVDESTDDDNAYNVLLMQATSGGTTLPGGSATTGRAAMVDNSGLIFNPGTNTLQCQNIVSFSGYVAADLIQATQTNTDITIRGNGQGHINLYDVVDVAPEYINLGHNVALYQTNSDMGVIIGYNDEANVTASNIQVGVEYQIIDAGDTTWTSIGSPNNTVGTIFTATGAGTGTGIAAPTSGQKRAFFGVDKSDNKFKYIPDATIVNNDTYNDMSATGNLGDAAFRNLTVEGGLLVNGNTTTITAESLEIEDPIIFIGNSNNSVDDNLDRGIVFSYNDGDPKQGFMGWDDSESSFVLYDDVSESNGVITKNSFGEGDLLVAGINSRNSSTIAFATAGLNALTIGGAAARWNFDTRNRNSLILSTSSTFGASDLQIENSETEKVLLDGTNNNIKLYAANTTVVTIDSAGLSVNGNANVSGLSVNGTLDVSGNVTFEDNIITVGTNADDGLDRGIAFPYFNTAANTSNQALLAWDDDRSRFILVRDGTITNGLVQSTSLAGMKLSELWFTRNPETQGFDINDMNIGAGGIATGGFPAQGYSTKSFIIIEGGSTATSSSLNYLRIGSSYSSNQSIVVHSGLTANVELLVEDANNFLVMSVGGTDKVTVGASSVTISDDTTINGDLFVDSNSTLYTDVITNYDNGLFLLSAAPGTLTMEISGPNETDGTVPTPVIIKGGDGSSSTVVGGDVEISGGNSTTDGVVKIEGQIFPKQIGADGEVLQVANSATGELSWGSVSSTDVLQNISKDNSSDAERFITFVDSASGAQEGKSDSGLKYNPLNNQISLSTLTLKPQEIKMLGGTGSLIFEKYNNHNANIELKDTSTGIFSLKRGGVTYIAMGDSTNNVKLNYNGSPKLETNSGGVDVTGTLTATAKSFLIDHPTKEGMKLKHGSLEGPENGVYVRGRLKGNNIIELPEYWLGLVDEDTITVELTPIGKHQKLFVKDIAANAVLVGNDNLLSKEINCFYTVYGERKDIDKMVVEYDAK